MLTNGKIRRRETRMKMEDTVRRLTFFTLARQADEKIEKEKR